MNPMQILIAPNAFKGSLDAAAAALAIETGLKQSRLSCTTVVFPIADGGDGTADLFMRNLHGEEVQVAVHDPLGRQMKSSFGLINQRRTAVIEMANASGLRLLKHSELNPMIALSTGTGELIKAALDEGVRKVMITMGGSATVDGGIGMLQALGARFLSRQGALLQNLPGSLVDLDRVDLSQLDPRLKEAEIVVLCDVKNKLLGPQGAAAVFGPQKGATPEQVRALDASLRRLTDVVLRETGRDMNAVDFGGTAGGASAGLFAMANAKLVNGIDCFLDTTGFDAALHSSNLLITGEGRIDEQTLQGKGPFGVAVRARRLGIPVVVLAGQVPSTKSHELDEYFDILLSIVNGPADIQTAMAQTREGLIRTARELGNMLALH